MDAMNFERDANRGPIIDSSAGSADVASAETHSIQVIVDSFPITVLASEHDAGEPQVVLPERVVVRCLGEQL